MASALEQLISNICQSYVHGQSFNDVLKLIKKSGDVLLKNAALLDPVMGTLEVEEHSLAVMVCLTAKLQAVGVSPARDAFEILMAQCSDFITFCNQFQIQLARDNFEEFCHLFAQSLIAQKCPIRGIELLRRAILKLQTSPKEMTAIHADLCQLCLLATCFKPVMPILDSDITVIAPQGRYEYKNFDVKHFLLYYYYGGMIYVAVKKYEEALYMFEVAVTTPARAVSHIMLEAYKKYILVSLILHGKVAPLPKYTSQVVNRFIRPLSVAYQTLANACQTNNREAACTAVFTNEVTFVRDKNLGLVHQVLASLDKNNIQRLTKTFLTLSLADVAHRVQLPGVEAAERYILNMIEDGEIFATVNRKDGMVIFHDDPEKYNNPAMLKKLEDEVTSCIELDQKIKAMEEEIKCSTVYVQKCSIQDDDSSAKIGPYSM